MPKHLFSHKATLEEITSAFAGQRKGKGVCKWGR